jgi:anti-anti-sigma factor
VTRVGDFEVRSAELPGGAVVLEVEGELDMATAPHLEERFDDMGLAGRTVIDLTACTFLDSSAVRVLVAAARDATAAGGTVALVATDPGILRVLDISGVDTLLPVHPSRDAAL